MLTCFKTNLRLWGNKLSPQSKLFYLVDIIDNEAIIRDKKGYYYKLINKEKTERLKELKEIYKDKSFCFKLKTNLVKKL